MHYKESAPFYHTRAWKQVRAAALARDRGMCCDCRDRYSSGVGVRPNRATMVHHIIPVEERPDLALSLENLRSLCDACHNKNHPEKGSGRQAEEPKQHKMRVIKI